MTNLPNVRVVLFKKKAWLRCTRPLVLKPVGGAKPAFRSDGNITAPKQDIDPISTGGAKELVRRAKYDPFGRGCYASLSVKGLSIVWSWTHAAGLLEGPLMRIVYQQKAGRRSIGPDQVGRILKEVDKNADVEPAIERGLSSHSMRVGAAQDLMVQGRNILQIMHAGGWKSFNVVSRYCEGADLNVWEWNSVAEQMDN